MELAPRSGPAASEVISAPLMLKEVGDPLPTWYATEEPDLDRWPSGGIKERRRVCRACGRCG